MSQSNGGFWDTAPAVEPSDLIMQGADLSEILLHNLVKQDMNFGIGIVVD